MLTLRAEHSAKSGRFLGNVHQLNESRIEYVTEV